ncbi:unnamed protein product [Alopecurus aequalis]
MALRLLCLCLCTTSLLLAGAVAVVVPGPAPSLVPSGNSCYKTVKGVPEECAQMFIKALFTNNTKGITDHCCILLACVKEWTCADVLRRFCLPPRVDDCPSVPPSSRSQAIAPAVTTGEAN